jgi:Co/Zn/Cd efflux system component
MRVASNTNLQIIAAFSAAVVLIVGYFAVVEPVHRTLSWLAVGLLAFGSLVVSLFGLFVRSVDERLFRVSEYQQRQAGASTQFPVGSGAQPAASELPSG